MASKRITCTAPVNIAVVKYWGKRNESLILPLNDSLSVTLDQNQLRAKTTVMASSEFTEDLMWLNNEKQSLSNPRVQKVLAEIRRRAKINGNSLHDCHIHICSENNFPTAAGLASSAAGYACLVAALAKLFDIQGEISDIARIGSGSACRSIYGGFVAWKKGNSSDGSDSIAQQVAPETHWPDLHIIVVVVNAGKKHTGSTEGMQTSVDTSDLLHHRVNVTVPRRMDVITQAILQHDFKTFAVETMKDSNQMHAICLDTYPSLSYMTDISREIQKIVHTINDFFGEIKVAYTYDAGPNACLLAMEKDVPVVLGVLHHFFPPLADFSDKFIRGLSSHFETPQELVSSLPIINQSGAINYIIHTKIGSGPQEHIDSCDHLLNESGIPQ